MGILKKWKQNNKMKRLKRKTCGLLEPKDALEAMNIVKFSFSNLPDCKKNAMLDECLKVINHAKKIRKRIDAA